MHLIKIGHHFLLGGHLGFYIFYQNFEFLIPNKTFVESFIGLFQEIFYEDFKKIVLNQIAAILDLTPFATLKLKIRDGNIPGITKYI